MVNNIISFLEKAEIKQSEALLESMSDRKLQDEYCECVNHKKKYSRAYDRLSNELNKRKDTQIKKECKTLEDEDLI